MDRPDQRSPAPAVADGVILVNPTSGPDEGTTAALRDAFAGHEIRELEPDEVAAEAAAARRRGARFVGVAGGDGTIRGAAAALCGGTTPLLPIPAGTKNHFARAVGLPTLEAAAAALADHSTMRVDTGWVNDECFVNNASIGIYPKIVRDRRAIEGRLPKRLATMVAAWSQVKRLTRFSVAVDGDAASRAWMVFVGNGCYGVNVFQAADRNTLSEGMLDLRVCHADARLSRLRAAGALLLGRIDRSRMVTRRTAAAFALECATAVDVALDGEVVRLSSPLAFRSAPASLSVYCDREFGQQHDSSGQEAYS